MTIVETIRAKPMRWLAVCHAFLLHVGESSKINGVKLVILLLAFPVFELHNLLFKISYSVGRRRLRRLSRRKNVMELKDLLLERDLDVIDTYLRVGSIQGLRKICERLEAAKARAEFSDHAFVSPSASDECASPSVYARALRVQRERRE
ncbi:MAG TPA: hypothetical protein VII63_08525 [Caulobacteraceae bacterium]